MVCVFAVACSPADDKIADDTTATEIEQIDNKNNNTNENQNEENHAEDGESDAESQASEDENQVENEEDGESQSDSDNSETGNSNLGNDNGGNGDSQNGNDDGESGDGGEETEEQSIKVSIVSAEIEQGIITVYDGEKDYCIKDVTFKVIYSNGTKETFPLSAAVVTLDNHDGYDKLYSAKAIYDDFEFTFIYRFKLRDIAEGDFCIIDEDNIFNNNEMVNISRSDNKITATFYNEDSINEPTPVEIIKLQNGRYLSVMFVYNGILKIELYAFEDKIVVIKRPANYQAE